MKRIFFTLLLMVFLNVSAGLAKVQSPVSDAMRAQMAERAASTLESREWTIYVTEAQAQAKGRRVAAPPTEADILTFKEGTVTSKNLSASGYNISNYTLRVQDDGVGIWETMQRNADVGVAFLRGEFFGSVMNGSITTKSNKGVKKTYYFSTAAPQ